MNHTLSAQIDKFDHWVISREGKREMLTASIAEADKKLVALVHDHDEIEKTILVLQKLAEIKRKMSTERIESLVTFGLKTVLAQDIRLKIKQRDSGNQVNSEFVIEEGEGENLHQVDIMEGEGGGVVKLTEFLLKLIVILMVKPSLRRFMACDENFAMVSVGNRGRLCELLRELAEKMDFQFLLVTHQVELEAAADKLYSVEKPGPESKLTAA